MNKPYYIQSFDKEGNRLAEIGPKWLDSAQAGIAWLDTFWMERGDDIHKLKLVYSDLDGYNVFVSQCELSG